MGLNVDIFRPSIGDYNLTSAVLQAILGAQITNTAISTAGDGVLTSAGLVAGQIARTGPSAAYTDTTGTAAAIVTALGAFTSGQTFISRIKNATPYVETIAAGTGVTLPTSVKNPPFSIANYYGVVGGTAASPTVTFVHIGTYPINVTSETANPTTAALTTVGAGTLIAAGINAGITVRSGSTSAFTDTTDSVANILAGVTALIVDGMSVEWVYINNTVAAATLAGAASVTIVGQTVVPPNSWAKYLITRASSTTITMTCIGQGFFPKSGTFVCNQATPVTVADAAVTATSQILVTLKTVGGTVGAIPHVATITPGTGFTIVGVASDTSTYNYQILG